MFIWTLPTLCFLDLVFPWDTLPKSLTYPNPNACLHRVSLTLPYIKRMQARALPPFWISLLAPLPGAASSARAPCYVPDPGPDPGPGPGHDHGRCFTIMGPRHR